MSAYKAQDQAGGKRLPEKLREAMGLGLRYGKGVEMSS